jgi:hypothetical protein
MAQQQTAQAVVTEAAPAAATIDVPRIDEAHNDIDEHCDRFTLLFNRKLNDGDIREFRPREPYRMSAVGYGWSDEQNSLFGMVFKIAQYRRIDIDGRDNGGHDNELNYAADQLLTKFRSNIWPSWCRGLVDDDDANDDDANDDDANDDE